MWRSITILAAYALACSLMITPAMASAGSWSAPRLSGLDSLDSLLLKVKKDNGDFFDEPFGEGRALCINDASKKQKESLYKKCSKKSGTAKCFESIQQCCCYYKPK